MDQREEGDVYRGEKETTRGASSPFATFSAISKFCSFLFSLLSLQASHVFGLGLAEESLIDPVEDSAW